MIHTDITAKKVAELIIEQVFDFQKSNVLKRLSDPNQLPSVQINKYGFSIYGKFGKLPWERKMFRKKIHDIPYDDNAFKYFCKKIVLLILESHSMNSFDCTNSTPSFMPVGEWRNKNTYEIKFFKHTKKRK